MKAREIRTNRIVLEDDQGRPRMILEAAGEGEGPGLTMLDTKGIKRMELRLEQAEDDDTGKLWEGARITLRDRNDNDRVELFTLDDGEAVLTLTDENGHEFFDSGDWTKERIREDILNSLLQAAGDAAESKLRGQFKYGDPGGITAHYAAEKAFRDRDVLDILKGIVESAAFKKAVDFRLKMIERKRARAASRPTT
jgi:hypothetical protein